MIEANAPNYKFLLISKQQIANLYKLYYLMIFTPYMYAYIPWFKLRMGLLFGEAENNNRLDYFLVCSNNKQQRNTLISSL
jgi:hypothetical protein